MTRTYKGYKIIETGMTTETYKYCYGNRYISFAKVYSIEGLSGLVTSLAAAKRRINERIAF